MKKSKKSKAAPEGAGRFAKVMYLAPRVLSIAYTIFISIFALDAFSPDRSFIINFLFFLVHLIPTYLLILITVIAWKWETIGGTLFLFTSLLSCIMGFLAGQGAIYLLLISLPLLVISILYFINGMQIRRLRTG